MKTIQEMLQELSQCIVTVSGEFRFRTNWNGGKVPQPDLDTFDPNVPFCIENVGDIKASVQYNTKNTNIKISKDYKTWNDYTSGTEIELNPKDRVYIKSDYVKDTGYNPRFKFSDNGARLRARGNIASLIYGTDDAYVNKYTSTRDYSYYRMFNGCTSLTQAPELPAITLVSNCYCSMFSGCTSLTQAPELSAIALSVSCYESMFYGCTSLTQAPELPATTLAAYCYRNMFNGCTSLTQAPELPAITLAKGCYDYMFTGCTGLTQAPELPATKLNDSCYGSMFSGCTSLTQAPELPATKLNDSCYHSMFYGCTSLNQAPELPATTLAYGCYYAMFQSCTSLTQAPELPSITLANYCYNSMFRGCTGLTQAPELPATTLSVSCYESMFYGCKKINYVKCLATYASAADYTKFWLDGVATTGDFYAPASTNWTSGISGIPKGWTRHDIT